jgi:photosystem II stability/assembly factor-like uncharacterized protein
VAVPCFVASATGTFPIVCEVKGHADKGMRGAFVVTQGQQRGVARGGASWNPFRMGPQRPMRSFQSEENASRSPGRGWKDARARAT